MFTKQTLQAAVDDLTRRDGAWTYDIPLPFGVWTRGNEGIPHTRLRRIVDTLVDLSGGSLEGRRVLDLGCLEGLFAIECATHGAEAVGVEIREAHLAKANLCKAALDLPKLSFSHNDVRRISVQQYGTFDFTICSGILYHLQAQAVVELVRTMAEMTERAVVIDTHVALRAEQSVRQGANDYWGLAFREHAEKSSHQYRAANGWASWDNTTSFWLTRPSLVNLLLDAGFTTVFETLSSPPLADDVGCARGDRCTLVALKGTQVQLAMSPAMNGSKRRWPEGSLSYASSSRARELVRSIAARLQIELKYLVKRN